MKDLVLTEDNYLYSEAHDMIEKLKEYYVYELIDPRDNRVFYVGKGKGERAHHHEIEADTSDVNNNKLHTIREIKDSGHILITRVIGRYDTEEEAFAVESTMIHWIYGKENLTNIAAGHNSEVIRPKGDVSEIPGIDIPPRERSNDGSYSLAKIEERKANGVVEYMNDVKKKLENILNISLSGVDTKSARFSYLYYSLNNCRIAVVTENRTLAVELQSLSSSKADRKKIQDICEATTFEKRKDWEYAKLPTFKSSRDVEEIAHAFINYLKELKLDLEEEMITKRWSHESIASTKKAFEKGNSCALKSLDGRVGVGVRIKDDSYKVILTEETELTLPLVYQTFEHLTEAGWVLG